MTLLSTPDPLDTPGARHDIEEPHLLVTKLTRPQVRSDLVERSRLRAMLDRGSERKLTLISTGPGYGKSTLAATWADSTAMPAAWLSLDAADNDPLSFFRYVIAALQTLDPELGRETGLLLRGTRVPSVRTLVTTLINALAVVTRPFALVLDDLHAIESPEILEGFALLVQNMPHTMRLIVTSRTDPPLPLLRMQARGELLEVRAEQLSFTLEESRALLTGPFQLAMSEPDLQRVQQWSEGWPIGLMLVGQRLQGSAPEDYRTLIDRLDQDDRFVHDYLWQETLEQQSSDRRAFLRQTAILERFDASLCAAVTGTPASGMLKQMERDNLFVIGLDSSGRWFRYHHLFMDALRAQLTESLSPGELRELHRRAAIWFQEHGTVEEATRHAMAAEEWELATSLLVQICTELMRQERLSNLRQWLEPVPAEVLLREPRLCLWLAWAWVRHGRVADALRMLESAGPSWSADEQESVRGLHLLICVLQTTYHQQPEVGIPVCDEALTIFDERMPSQRGVVLLLKAILHEIDGDIDAAEPCLREMNVLAARASSQALHLMERNAYAGMLIMRGRLREAIALERHVIATGDEWNDIVVHYAHWQLAEVLIARDELAEAEELIQRGYQISLKTSAPLHRPRFHQYFAELALARGELDIADAELDRAAELAHVIGADGEVRQIEARRARVWMAAGNLDAARDWARDSRLDPNTPPAYPRMFEHLVLLRLMILDGRAAKARAAIEPALVLAERENRGSDLLELLVFLAMAEQALGNERAATAWLLRALRLAEPEGVRRLFIGFGAPMEMLLRAALRIEGAHRAFVRSLLEAIVPQAGATGYGGSELLSPRETEVLQLIAAGESNRQIADHLFISEQTVKKHVSNVFEKLSVESRTQAVARARQLGILQDGR